MFGVVRRSANERGFTLIEGAVSIVLLSITIIGMYNTIILARRFVVDARRVTEATNFGRMKLERVVDTDFADIMSKYASGVVYDANNYDEYFCEQDPDYDQAGGDYAYEHGLPNAAWHLEYQDNNGAPASSNDDPLTIRLIVSWQEGGGLRERSIVLSTRVTSGRM